MEYIIKTYIIQGRFLVEFYKDVFIYAKKLSMFNAFKL